MLSIRSALVPVDPAKVSLDLTLPYDLFNQNGVLILRRGSRLDEPSKMDKLHGLRLYRFDRVASATPSGPVSALEALAGRFSALTADSGRITPAQLTALADQLHQLTLDHPATSLGLARHLHSPSPARAKALFVSVLGCLVAARMGLDQDTQRTLILAGITMNLSSFELQDQLNFEGRGPTTEECEVLWQHPKRSAELLRKAGVRDINWLNAVRQHHENLDRSGYPYRVGVDVLMPEARILRVTDIFSAMLGGRPMRMGHAPRQAMRMTFERERGRLDDAVMLTLRRVMGYYPPGTLVKLANRETAVVTRWFGNAEGPDFVVSILRPSGTPMQAPLARSTRSAGQAIRGFASLPAPTPELDWARIWAQG